MSPSDRPIACPTCHRPYLDPDPRDPWAEGFPYAAEAPAQPDDDGWLAILAIIVVVVIVALVAAGLQP